MANPALQKGALHPIFGPCLIAFGTEVGLSPDDIVCEGDSALLPKKGHSNPHFSAHV